MKKKASMKASGFYFWFKDPIMKTIIANAHLPKGYVIPQKWLPSGCVPSQYPKCTKGIILSMETEHKCRIHGT